MDYDFVESERIKKLDAEYIVDETQEKRRELADVLAEKATREFEHDVFGIKGEEIRDRLKELHEESDSDVEVAVKLAETLEAEVRYNFSISASVDPLPSFAQRQRVTDLLDLVAKYDDERVVELTTSAVEKLIKDYGLPELSNTSSRVEVDNLDATIELFERIVKMDLDVNAEAALSEMRSHRETAKQEAKRERLKSRIFPIVVYTIPLLLLLPPVLGYGLVTMKLTGQGPIEIIINQLIYDLSPSYRVGQIVALVIFLVELLVIRIVDLNT
ncbi:hypothetical protein G3I44_18680 [Halogeometricum borinquense]|uniref:Uncharacterized protein n=1 Tax=Halogeometricum borinquense TaxID=60847 RepID=A0A6C0UL07_9EURY|nr:hypothetical protein [Halogeometricum borinquense]QIB76114.1 hypothetical protein G3I44_18680 [Halogeometricum borinquense]